ncbi:multiple sugar transport system permease protein [Naumannella cuiyingiana]|uniref:Multiple sugar transport system permease protein n=1 Tax=Naumannella cuiyingiana TaxID=1347891 RepID=A0A7Z0D6Z3_9ACTN|nr:sugar ABC transporter permease [Naumannella cuiyingiana]NYI69988.1 multiple sugar transport system permease protein [Naumannella cuiyingiana]
MASRKARRESAVAYALLAPSLAGIACFLLLPVLVVFWLSLNRWNLLGPLRFVGLANWVEVLADPTFGHSLLVTLAFVAMVIPLQTGLGLLVAVLLSRGLPGSGLFRVIYVVPWVCAPLALGIVWQWIFAPFDGALNALLGVPIEWLSTPALALPAVAAVTIWSQVGYVALFFMAGLAGIPRQVIEAAEVDGAGPWRIFFSIKLPLLAPTFFFVLVTGVIASFQAFDQIWALTPNGGPQGATDVIATRIYLEAFRGAFNLGQASVMAVILFALLVVVTVVQQRWFAKRVTYDLS